MKAFIWLIILGIVGLVLLGIAFLAFGVYVVATRLGMPTVEPQLTGFWLGIWQGLIVCLSFITSWFDKSITIYQAGNNGFWYNLGYLIGLGVSIGAFSHAKKD